MTTRDKRCENCAAWEGPFKNYDEDLSGIPSFGYCHRVPPLPIIEEPNTEDEKVSRLFARTWPDDWCMIWCRKEKDDK